MTRRAASTVKPRSRLTTIALYASAILLLIVLSIAGWIAYTVPKPWRSGVQELGGDCSRSFASSPRNDTGATITGNATGRDFCGYGFALQQEGQPAARYTLHVESGELDGGELLVSLSAYDGWRRLDRTRRRLQGPADLANLRLQLDVPARATLVELRVQGRPGARFTVNHLKLRATPLTDQDLTAGRAMFDEAAEIIAAHALNASKLPPDFRERWRPPADASPGEARQYLRALLRMLGDNHSFLIDPDQRSDRPHRERQLFTPARGKVLAPGIGYVQVPGFAGGDRALRDRYTKAITDALADGHRQGVRGWVVDLRENKGGSMWPMLNGLEPLLRDQPLGFFETRDGSRTPWRNKRVPDAAAVPDMGALPVAVLTSGRTASSGEAVVLAFRGRPGTRQFGAATYGLSTANKGHALKDGTILQLTGSLFLDRNGQGDGTPVRPDEPVRELFGTDRTEAAAVAWLRTQLQ